MTTEMIETGADLSRVLLRNHPKRRNCPVCPVCGDGVQTVAVVNLVYVMEPCDCPSSTYTHLVATLYHAVCYQPRSCEKFAPFWVRGRVRRPGHFTYECYTCGRLERSHG